MRPIKLTMSAFGSYSGMETIDFTKIQGGLFLVTGDTGAGKNNDLRCGDICSLRQDKRRTARRKYDEKPVCRRRGGNIRGIYVCISGRAVYDPKKPGIYARGKAEKCRRKDPPCKGNVKSQPDHARREGVSGEKA